MNNADIRLIKLRDIESICSSLESKTNRFCSHNFEEYNIDNLLSVFPEGQFVVVLNENILGYAFSFIVNYDSFGDEHTFPQITGNLSFSTHDTQGDVLYGIYCDLHPELQNYHLGQLIWDAMQDLCKKLNLKAIVTSSTIPINNQMSPNISDWDYLQKVKHNEIFDSSLSSQFANDFHAKRIIKGYFETLIKSENMSVLMQWDNIFYEYSKTNLSKYKPIIRISLIQWRQRSYQGLKDFFEQIDHVINVASMYKSDFVLFPEYFNISLIEKYISLDRHSAIRQLATHTEKIRDYFVQLAINYNINIITGSMPYIDKENLFNVGYLCRRNGSWESYKKLHITPDEVKSWGVVGGDKISMFETDCGPIGILICYDVEFPELSRVLAEMGMKILFVPFLTSTQNGYSRIRNCSMARAIENECYVAIAGSVGDLPNTHNMAIHYAQSAVFTPCDFFFPPNGIQAEATANTEMILVADVDLDLLSKLHTLGAVQNLSDRRKDIYQIIIN